MREIKFRAWHKRKKVYITHEELFNFDCSNEFPFLALINGHYDDEDMEVIIEQYTGLKDVNGVEIYEGDILKCVDEIGTQIAPVEYAETIASFIVRYKKGDKHYYSPLNKGDLSRDLYLQETEIIGNIYENSELLE